jgi:sucrose-6-phosphate hydrolase SacC (GH32 family)
MNFEKLSREPRSRGWQVSRRDFLAASAGLVLPRWAWAEVASPEAADTPVLAWRLEDREDSAREEISGVSDPITSHTGHATWVGEGKERALRMDGYSVWVAHTAAAAVKFAGAMTIAVWIALEAYPVNDAAIVQIAAEPACGLILDKWGRLLFSAGPVDTRNVCRSAHPVPRGKWVHVAAAIDASGEAALYLDGVTCGHAAGLRSLPQSASAVVIGKWDASPVVAKVFSTGVINGLVRGVEIYASALTPGALQRLFEQSQPASQADLQINRAWCAADPQRPHYHAQPPRAWTNEPHGCIYWQGQYHLFYQKNANGPYWGNINWGHMTSPDLYHWKEMPVALSPEPGPDAEGCWSGSVIDHDGKLALIYTGGDGHRASICLATSTDGLHFSKYQANPIIAAPPEGHNYPEFRDPFVWREGETYYLMIGSAVKDVGGTALLYRSEDLVTWRYLKPLLIGDKASSGTFWEMPIFVKVGQYHVLIVCEVPGRASYWVGTWENENFQPIFAEPQRLELFNHLLSPTPHTAGDGQVITMGIIPDQRHSEETWKAGWAHLYSLPRVLSVDADGRLRQTPLEKIDTWSQPLFTASDIALEDGALKTFPNASGTCLRIDVACKRGASRSVSLFVRRSPDAREQTEVRYAWDTGAIILDRTRSSLDPMVKQDTQTTPYKTDVPDEISFVLYLDVSVLEVFVDGRAAFATRIYPSLAESIGIAASCAGQGASISSLDVRSITLNAHEQ